MQMQLDGGVAASSSSSAAANASKTNASAAASLPWVEKYRPTSLDQLVSHGEIISTINRLVEQNSLPHLLFYGPPGTGKTSTILALARKLYGNQYQNMILELNASDERGIDVVRDQIKDFASTRNILNVGPKLVVLDEADNMTNPAQAALRRVIEKYSKNARFCLICNYVSKIIPALQSRCTRFRFQPLDGAQVAERLRFVIAQEGLTQRVTDNGLAAVVRLGGGDLRKCLNTLQSCAMAYDMIDEDAVYTCTGNPLPSDVQLVVSALLNQEFGPAIGSIQQLKTIKGLALADLLRDIHLVVLRLAGVNDRSRMQLLDRMADIEANLASGGSEHLQLTALVSAFQLVRDDIALAAGS